VVWQPQKYSREQQEALKSPAAACSTAVVGLLLLL
jgi:hypothetical protein